MFADNERLQQHTQTHFIGDTTEVLREQLLKKWNKRLKKKKKKRKSHKDSSPSPTPEPMTSSDSRVKKTYSCLLCNMTFCKKKSWRIHKVRKSRFHWLICFCFFSFLYNRVYFPQVFFHCKLGQSQTPTLILSKI